LGPPAAEAAPPPPPRAPADPAAPSTSASLAAIDLEAYESADALAAAVPPEALKEALAGSGLKCGGTPAQRAARLWLLKGGKGLEAVPRQHWAKPQ
jgi:hypothetical protein